jgi:hypothetical protein
MFGWPAGVEAYVSCSSAVAFSTQDRMSISRYIVVGVIQCLEREGYAIDYVAGSSMGAVVAVWLAFGMTGSEIEALLHDRFAPTGRRGHLPRRRGRRRRRGLP